jgi:hypothetical protein
MPTTVTGTIQKHLQIHNDEHSVYTIKTQNGLLYIYLLITICSSHGGHLQATLITAHCESVHF